MTTRRKLLSTPLLFLIVNLKDPIPNHHNPTVTGNQPTTSGTQLGGTYIIDYTKSSGTLSDS